MADEETWMEKLSCTRAEVLSALRQYGRPVTPMNLAVEMGRSPTHVASVLRVLYFMNKVDRVPIYGYRRRYHYAAKELAS
jgi:hypothetical protein